LSISLVILDEPAETGCPGEGSFDDPTARQQDKAAFGLGELDDLVVDAMSGSSLGCGLSGIAPIHPGDLDTAVCHGLNGSGQLLQLAAILRTGCGNVQRQQVIQRIDHDVQLGALFALGSELAAPLTAFGCWARGVAVDDGSARLRLAPRRQAQNHAQIINQRLEAPGRQPTLRLLLDRRPRRQIMGHPTPGCT